MKTKESDQITERFDLQWMGAPFESGVEMILNPINGNYYVSHIHPHGASGYNEKDGEYDKIIN